MNIYSKTLKKEIELELYEIETGSGQTKTLVTSCSLLKVFNSMPEITRSFPVQIMNKDYCYARCVINTPFGVFDNDGDANAEFEMVDIDKHHIGMCASRRAFDRAFLDALSLSTECERVYSSSEGISGTRVIKEKEEMKQESEEYNVGSDLVFDEEPVDERAPESSPIVSYDDYCIKTNCAQKGKTLGNLYREGRQGFLINLYKITKTNSVYKEDTAALEGFFKSVGIKVV